MFADRELVEQITENPYLQYFAGLSGYQKEAAFDASTLVLFRKRISKEDANEGTLILDAICAPANIRYPQDISLLNEAREKLETIIYRFCKSYGLPLPRRYSRCARKDYLAFAKSKKHSAKKIRKALRKQLGYVARDIRYLEQFMGDGYAMKDKEISLYLTIIRLHGQQQYMYDNKVRFRSGYFALFFICPQFGTDVVDVSAGTYKNLLYQQTLSIKIFYKIQPKN